MRHVMENVVLPIWYLFSGVASINYLILDKLYVIIIIMNNS